MNNGNNTRHNNQNNASSQQSLTQQNPFPANNLTINIPNSNNNNSVNAQQQQQAQQQQANQINYALNQMSSMNLNVNANNNNLMQLQQAQQAQLAQQTQQLQQLQHNQLAHQVQQQYQQQLHQLQNMQNNENNPENIQNDNNAQQQQQQQAQNNNNTANASNNNNNAQQIQIVAPSQLSQLSQQAQQAHQQLQQLQQAQQLAAFQAAALSQIQQQQQAATNTNAQNGNNEQQQHQQQQQQNTQINEQARQILLQAKLQQLQQQQTTQHQQVQQAQQVQAQQQQAQQQQAATQFALAQQQYIQQLQAQAQQQQNTPNNTANAIATNANNNVQTQLAQQQYLQQLQAVQQAQAQAQQQQQQHPQAQNNLNINQQRVTQVVFNAISQITLQLQATQAQLHSIVPQLTSLQTQLQTPSTNQNTQQLETHYRAVSSAYEQHYRQYLLYLQQIQQLQTYLQQHQQQAVQVQQQHAQQQAASLMIAQQHAQQQQQAAQQLQQLNQQQAAQQLHQQQAAQQLQAQLLQVQQLQAQQQQQQQQQSEEEQLTQQQQQAAAQLLLQHAAVQLAQQQQLQPPQTQQVAVQFVYEQNNVANNAEVNASAAAATTSAVINNESNNNNNNNIENNNGNNNIGDNTQTLINNSSNKIAEVEAIPFIPPQPQMLPSISIESITNPNDSEKLKKLVDAPEFIPTPHHPTNNSDNHHNLEAIDKDIDPHKENEGNEEGMSETGDLDENGDQSGSQKPSVLRVDAAVFQPDPNQLMSHPKYVATRQQSFQNPFGSQLATISEVGPDDLPSRDDSSSGKNSLVSTPIKATVNKSRKLPNIREKIIQKESAMNNMSMADNRNMNVNMNINLHRNINNMNGGSGSGTNFKFVNGNGAIGASAAAGAQNANGVNGHFVSEGLNNGYNNDNNNDRDPVSGQQLSADNVYRYSVSVLWEYRTNSMNEASMNDFENLVLEDENFEELNKISIEHTHQRLEINRILSELSLLKEGAYLDECEGINVNAEAGTLQYADDHSFVRGINVNVRSKNRRQTKLSDTATQNAYQPKMEHLLSENELLTKRVMGVLNKITPEKFNKLATKMMSIISELADDEKKFTTILDSILNKASTEPVFAEQYANLCYYLSQQLPSLVDKFQWILGDESSKNKKKSSKNKAKPQNKKNIEDPIAKQISKVFRKMMIMSCERRFSSQRQQVLERLPSDLDEESRADLQQRRKKKFFGTMIIVGQLFNKKLVHSNIINKGIIVSLLPPENKSLSPIEIEALCKLLKTCGKAMDKDDKSHKILSKYIHAMKTHSADFEFRIQVIVDEIEEMKNNNWELRIKQEKAKTLDEIHKDFAKQQQKSNNKHHQHQQKQQYYKKKPHANNKHHYHHNKHKPQINKEKAKEKVLNLTKECLGSGSCKYLIDHLLRDNNHLICNKFWGEITNIIFINRSSTEIDKFIKYLIELFCGNCIHNTHDEFVEHNILFLALNCDDSAQDCPLFTKYLGILFAKLFENNFIPITCLEYFHTKYFNSDKDSEYSVDAKTKMRRFSKIVLSILNCLTQSNSENVLKQISKQTSSFINSDNIDRNVFYDNMSLFERYISSSQ